jgi:hypothetical protein
MMRFNCRLLLLTFMWFSVQPELSAESKPLELKWTELSSIIASHRVELTLTGGGSVAGDAIAVREDTLVLDVKKSSGTNHYAKGNASIPRSSVTLISLQKSRGTWGRTLGTTLGVVTGLGVGGYSAAHTNSGGVAVAVLVSVTSGLAVIGYYAGRGLDRATTRIVIVP